MGREAQKPPERRPLPPGWPPGIGPAELFDDYQIQATTQPFSWGTEDESWTVELTWRPKDGEVSIDQVSVTFRGPPDELPPGGINVRLLRELPIAEARAMLRENIRIRAWSRYVEEHGGAEHLPATGWTDRDVRLAQVAEDRLKAQDDDPKRPIEAMQRMHRYRRSRPERVRELVHEAVARDFLRVGRGARLARPGPRLEEWRRQEGGR